MTKFYRDLAASTGRPAWMADGACVDMHPELWFADTSNALGRAKEICSGCPSVVACLQFAIDNNERDGVWGGRTPKERVSIKRAAQYNAKRTAA